MFTEVGLDRRHAERNGAEGTFHFDRVRTNKRQRRPQPPYLCYRERGGDAPVTPVSR